MAQPPSPAPLEGAPAPKRLVGGRSGNAAIAFIFITVTIDTIAMGVTAPVLPQLIERLSGDPQQAGVMNGLFMTIFALLQFIFSPILGALSDRYGRRPILLLSIAGLGLSYAAMGMATSLWQLLLIRAFTGATSANIATAFAYVADVTPVDRRAGAYGLMQGAMSMGFALGPGIGGLFGNLSPTAPFWVAAAISLINAVYGYFVVPESLPMDQRAPFRVGNLRAFGGISMLRSKPGLFSLAMILMLAQFATMVFPTVFVLYAMHRYAWNITAVSICMTAFGVCSALVQARVAGPFVRRWGEHNAIVFGLLAGVLAAFIFGLAPNGVIFSIGIPIMTLSGLTGPAVQSLMTRKVAHFEQGRLQGANTSLQSVAGIVAPLLFGWIYAVAIIPHGGINLAGAPFYLASLVLAGATVIAWRAVQRERSVA